MNTLSTLQLCLIGPVLASTAAAQISNQNDCANSAMDVVGPGSYAYDTTAATTGTEGQMETLCNAFGTLGIDGEI